VATLWRFESSSGHHLQYRALRREKVLAPGQYLSGRSIEVARELQKLYDGRRYVFANQANHEKPMRENTLVYSIYRMSYHSRATARGFRATASTILNEYGFRPDVIARQLAHVERKRCAQSTTARNIYLNAAG